MKAVILAVQVPVTSVIAPAAVAQTWLQGAATVAAMEVVTLARVIHLVMQVVRQIVQPPCLVVVVGAATGAQLEEFWRVSWSSWVYVGLRTGTTRNESKMKHQSHLRVWWLRSHHR